MTKSDLYKDSGVDIHKGERLVDWLKDSSQSKDSGAIGGFAGVFAPDFTQYQNPVLVSGTDGVGTKLLLGLDEQQLSGLGIDLVAMCVNDLYTVGAKPLFFLDYYATGQLDEQQFKDVLTGIREGLAQAETALLGGETAELPGMYQKGHFDLAGFVVGIGERDELLGPERAQAGDVLIGLPSSGFHSNGYSLVRQWLSKEDQPDASLIQRLLEPTKIYHQIPKLVKASDGGIHALAHITGGGISGNLPRVLPQELLACIERSKIPTPAWMQAFIARHGAGFEDVETVFNMGLGMIAAVSQDKAEAIFQAMVAAELEPVVIGRLEVRDQAQEAVRYDD